ncbi:MAG: S1 RNA-binding domain-containing protein [Candidatus Anammoximicrobium sp.]|nr:S1 RNA-binding domain-containing protein [Candidatus Anammoximicrobium sp.]
MNIDPIPVCADTPSDSPSSAQQTAAANLPGAGAPAQDVAVAEAAVPAAAEPQAGAAVPANDSGGNDSAQPEKPRIPAEPPLRRLVQNGPRRPDAAERRAAPRRGGFRGRSGGPRPPRDRAPDAEGAGGDRDPLLDTAALEERPRGKVPPPSRRQPLSADLEQEFESLMAGASMEELVAGSPAAATVGDGIEIDSRRRAVVVKIHGDDVFFALDGRNEGVASVRQFRDPPDLGLELEVVVTGYNPDDGFYLVSVPGSSVDVQDWSDLVQGAVVEARVTGSNVGGLECLVGHIRGFIPASQIEVFRVEHYPDYYDKKLLCLVTEANERRRNLVLSHRALVEREKEEQRQQLLAELQVGDVREGTVTSIRDFGAFVDIGGLDGLIHISQLSWEHVSHPSEVLQVGQKIRVKVEKVHQQTGKIGLNYRDLLDHPWHDIETRFPVDTVVKGVVTRTAKFGAFVKLAPGVEGLVHISELAHHRVVQVTNVVHEGEEIEVKVLSVDPESQRISLSLKDAHPIPTLESMEAAEQEPDEPLRKPVVPPSGKPLKGGTTRESGGEKFGLNW